MDKLPNIGDYLYIKSGTQIIRNLKVISVEERKIIKDSIITVSGNYERTYNKI